MKTRHIPIELRAAEDGPEGILEGYASIYGNEYAVGGGLNEVIQRGAFDSSIEQGGGVVPLFWNHGWAKPANAAPIGVAYIRSGDPKGLPVRAEVFMDDPTGAAVWRAAKAGALNEWSIGFKADEVKPRGNVEEVHTGTVVEASVVVRGANPLTEMVGVREEASENENEDESTTDESDQNEDGTDPAIVEQAYGLLAHRGGRAVLKDLIQNQE